MKYKAYLVIASILCVIVNTAKAEEQYWKTIKNYILAYDKAEGISENDRISKEFSEYLDSLTSEQLIEAGKQCSEEGNASFHKKGFAEGTGFVISFFIAQYPKTTGLENLQPIFIEIEDANQTDMWRSTLIHSFSTSLWQKKLSDSQLRDVTNNIDKIITSKNVYYRTVNESLYTTRAMLQEMESRKAINASLTNDVNKSNQENKAKETTEYYTRFSRRLISISNEPNLNPELQEVSFVLMRDVLDKPIRNKTEVNTTLANAVRNYEKYDVKTWRLLSQIGIEKLKITDGEQIAKEMADKLELKIKNEPNNIIKRPLQSELESIKRSMQKQTDK